MLERPWRHPATDDNSILSFPQEHKLQMAEALDNFQAVQEAHKKELSEMQDAANQQMRRELEVLQRTIQERNGEARQLQKQLADLERDRHTEVVKLRLEYDAKLLKLQKQNTKSQCGQSSSSSINHEIFRRVSIDLISPYIKR